MIGLAEMTENSESLCFVCLYRDSRPELGAGRNLIYCVKKDRVISPKTACELFVRSTERSREEFKNSIYGSYPAEEEEG